MLAHGLPDGTRREDYFGTESQSTMAHAILPMLSRGSRIPYTESIPSTLPRVGSVSMLLE